MLERLDYVKIAPQRILDAGSGPARDAQALLARYPKAGMIALDFAVEMLRESPARFGLLRRNPAKYVCGDLARLPLAGASVDFIWSNMAVHWASDPVAVFREFSRVLAPAGLVMFSTLGPDTLKELRAAGARRVHPFIDMHDLGDMLVGAGFTAPVMDMEMLHVQLLEHAVAARGPARLGPDLRKNRSPERPRDKDFAAGLKRALGERPSATFEVVYGHAWKAAAREDAKMIRIFKRIP